MTEAIAFSEPAVRRLARHYYARMASLALVALVFGWLQHIVASDPVHVPSMGPGVALAIGVANGIAAWILFGPIHRCLEGRGNQAVAMARVVRLPRQSAVWTFVLSAAVMTIPFVAGYIQCPECAPAGGGFALLYHAILMSIHAVLMALFMYFFVDDYTTGLKLELYRLCDWEMPAGRGGVVTKLLAAYLATAAAPFVLVFLDVFFADRLEALQMLDLRQAFLLDTIGAVAMTGVAVIFLRRGLVRPLEQLLAAMQRVDAGDLTRRAPVVSDDELGMLTERFNRMIEQLSEKEFQRQTFGRYVPKHIANAIVENRGALAPQQRVATILFTDIQDFTRIAERLPPDQLVSLLNEYFSQVVEIVERHGGVVTQFQGDALLVVYNVPIEDPAHAANAVCAALEIESAINHRRFGDGVEFITRVGINTGLVVAGPVGAENRLIYTVHGDAVNLAARLEALNKELGTRILVAESTRELAGRGFAFTALGEVSVRGRSEPVLAHTVAA
ncbi:MAG: HAMP domain-containing protein [Betaproteobacteria bacterium]|nr:HAMP domain-containing protein [Betaproteobacteria bacterium]